MPSLHPALSPSLGRPSDYVLVDLYSSSLEWEMRNKLGEARRLAHSPTAHIGRAGTRALRTPWSPPSSQGCVHTFWPHTAHATSKPSCDLWLLVGSRNRQGAWCLWGTFRVWHIQVLFQGSRQEGKGFHNSCKVRSQGPSAGGLCRDLSRTWRPVVCLPLDLALSSPRGTVRAFPRAAPPLHC